MPPKFIIVDVEGGAAGGHCAGDRRMGEFGAVLFDKPPFETRFYGKDDSVFTLRAFDLWLETLAAGDRIIFVSDNVAYDWQHINWALWNRVGHNRFGHSGRRIGDFYAGMKGDWRDTQGWKKLRVMPHDDHPVNDALGNAEALWSLTKGSRERKRLGRRMSKC